MSGRYYTRGQIAAIRKRESENWIYSYSDLITNMLALFTMLLIVNSMGESAKQGLQDGFKKYLERKTDGKILDPNAPLGEGVHTLEDVKQVVTEYLKQNALASQVQLTSTRKGLALTFNSGLVFDSGSADIKEEAVPVLTHTANIISQLPGNYMIDVEGHADNRPVVSGNFPSNWELSSARAGSVVRFFEGLKVKPRKMRAIGFGSSRPLDKTGKADINRRVVVKIDAEDSGKQ